ncbi:MAG: insulinase family protein [Caldilineaceae bacterium SB0664_bin_27]|uniref:Insulinase family protein n=1 Tax=Caldilineaceae bacterium SB0664_bin_27 TaxID=2605260 RepID=A0A6B0Z144_9CHLR|nr:insulinase family protein [Caldilineaceae bacterium SB0664_bin_27]
MTRAPKLQPGTSTRGKEAIVETGQKKRDAKLLVGLLLLIALLTSACEGMVPTSQSSAETMDSSTEQAEAPAEETEQAQAYLDVDSETLDMSAPIALDPSIRKAQLENGLTYYIRHNTEPANRATLMLVINAGSVQEDEDQLGLAHFVEHMMFNGTERFPKQALIDYFETVGMSFGPDVNAYTSFDETVYFLEFPTDDEEIIGTTFQVAEDWASRATISDEEVESERGVILEEERLRDQNASGRLNKQLFPLILGESRYTDRMPIGDMDIVQNTPGETLRSFYRDWYRPDLMAVIVVGDIDVDDIEAKIEEHFGPLTAPETVRPRVSYSLPDYEDTGYLILTDPEFPVTIAQIIYRQAAQDLNSANVFRDRLIGNLFYKMLNFRLDDLTREADSPFLGAFVSEGQLVRGNNYQVVGVQVRQGEALSSLDAALTEVERVRRYGFTAAEVERAKSEILNTYERLYNDRENLRNHSLASEYSRNYLENEAVPGIEVEFKLVDRLLQGISRDDVNQRAELYVGGSNRSVFVVGPERDADSLPNEDELAAMISDLQTKQVDPYQDIEAVSALLTEIPEPVEIISRQTDETFNITDLTLANGARVVLKPTTFKEEEILFSASSPGGSSLVSDEDYPEADFIDSIVSQSAVGDVSYAALQRLLADKSVSVSPFIGELEEGFHGQSGQEFIETLFQLVYLYGTQPRADDDAFATLKDQYTESLRNRELDPRSAWTDAYIEARYGDSVRRKVPSLEVISSLDLERAFAIYQERFADFSDFTFIFVGNFDLEQMVDWSQRYLGNLPSLDRAETWLDVAPDPPTGVVEVPVYRGQDEQSLTTLLFTGPSEDSLDKRLNLRMLEMILDILMREELREELGGVYAFSASASMEPDPDSLYRVSLTFGSDPARVEELVDALFGLIADVQADGPREDLLEKARAQIIRQREEQLEQNSYWMRVLEYWASEDDVDLTNFVDLDVVEGRTEAVTAAEVQAAAIDYLPLDRYILVSLYPEDFEE